MSLLEIWNITRGASNLKLVLALPFRGESGELKSKSLTIDNLVHIRFKWQASICDGKPEVMYQYSLLKCDTSNNCRIKTTIRSEQLDYYESGIHTPKYWSPWKHMGTQKAFLNKVKPWPRTFLTHISVTIYEEKTDKMSSILYGDTEFTDFCLSTAEGSVAVHKACLAAHSDVFKTLLKGEWKETAEGQVKIKGVTLDTLHQLKDYFYLGTLPEGDGLRPLLLIARCYLIKDLEKHCILKLAETVTSRELFSLIDFACENQIPELPFTLLKLTQDKVVQDAHFIKEWHEKAQRHRNDNQNKTSDTI